MPFMLYVPMLNVQPSRACPAALRLQGKAPAAVAAANWRYRRSVNTVVIRMLKAQFGGENDPPRRNPQRGPRSVPNVLAADLGEARATRVPDVLAADPGKSRPDQAGPSVIRHA
jgi:hypothetical protein